MINDKTHTSLLISFCCLSFITFSLFVFYQFMPIREEHIGAHESGGMGGWYPGQIEVAAKASDQKGTGDHERGTTFHMKNEEPDPVSTNGCSCRWMFNVYRDSSYKQKKNEIGWLKGHSNGFETWYTKHVYDIRYDRSLLNRIGLASPEEASLTNRYRGETTIEIKHIQGCNRCFGKGSITFDGVQTEANNIRIVKPKDAYKPDERQIDVRSETVLNQRDEAEGWGSGAGPVRDHARLRVQSKATHRIDRRDEYTIKEYGLNYNRWPQIVARCNCDHPSCSNPVDAFIRTSENWMVQQIGRMIDAEKRASGSVNRHRMAERLSKLSSGYTKKMVWKAVWEAE